MKVKTKKKKKDLSCLSETGMDDLISCQQFKSKFNSMAQSAAKQNKWYPDYG